MGVAASASGRFGGPDGRLRRLGGWRALSMAAGEYVSVSSQADLERADLRARAAMRCAAEPEAETEELAEIYVDAGADAGAWPIEVADAADGSATRSAAHARDELGLSEATSAQPDRRRSRLRRGLLTSALCFPTLAALLASGRRQTIAGGLDLDAGLPWSAWAPSARGSAARRSSGRRLRVGLLGRGGDGRDRGESGLWSARRCDAALARRGFESDASVAG